MNFKNLNFTRISSFSQAASQPAIRPGCASATALEFLHNKDNFVGFTKLLFQRTFINCAMVLPFILYYLTTSVYRLSRSDWTMQVGMLTLYHVVRPHDIAMVMIAD